MRKPTISIVTVCFNEKKNIAFTIKSVLAQVCCDYELIICDGGSTDSTVRIAESFQDKFMDKGVDYRIYSERDGGVYFGMNKGISHCSGKYILFLNAGDCFHNKQVVEKAVSIIQQNEHEVDVFYGDALLIERNYVQGVRVGDDTLLTEAMSICHQCVFAKADLLRLFPFNTQYRIGADYDFLLHMKILGKTFYHMDFVVSDFFLGGLSTEKILESYQEQQTIKGAYGYETDKGNKLEILKEKAALQIKQKLPEWLWNFWSSKVKKKQIYVPAWKEEKW